MKRLITGIAALLSLCALLCGCSIEQGSHYPKPTEQFFVNDFAEVIDSADENEIYSRGVALNEKTTAQVVVVTVDDLDGEEPADYALNLGREWGVGVKDKDNGVVILLSKDDRRIYIAVGYGLEGALPDSKTGRIIDRYGLNYLKEDNFSAGLQSIQKAIINEVYIEYGVEPEDGYVAIDNLPQEKTVSDSNSSKVIASWIILFAVIFIYVAIFGRRRRGFFWFGGPGGFGGHGGFGGRGGFGGGGFSGGGGSFGGGGAGRGF